MNIFVTGASGWIGSAVTAELIAAGHSVTGLARSDASAERVAALGAAVRNGSLDDLGALRAGAESSDGVIHLGFNHDFSDYQGAGRTEREAVTTLASVLQGSDRPLLIASGVAGLAQGRPATENDRSSHVGPDAPRGGSEELVLSLPGVHSISARFAPTVHGEGDHGFTAALVAIARQHGASGYIDDGSNQWPAVHRLDAARLVRLGFEQADTRTVLHAIAEPGIPTRQIAEAIGEGLNLPAVSIPAAEAGNHFGWLARFFGMDATTSSDLTRERFGWTPTGPTLLEDLQTGSYFRA